MELNTSDPLEKNVYSKFKCIGNFGRPVDSLLTFLRTYHAFINHTGDNFLLMWFVNECYVINEEKPSDPSGDNYIFQTNSENLLITVNRCAFGKKHFSDFQIIVPVIF